jgi:hypothetical protein
MAVITSSEWLHGSLNDGDIIVTQETGEIEICWNGPEGHEFIVLKNKQEAQDLIIALHIAIAKTWPS